VKAEGWWGVTLHPEWKVLRKNIERSAARADTDRHRQTQTDTDRHRQTQTDTDRHRQTQTDTDRHRHRAQTLDILRTLVIVRRVSAWQTLSPPAYMADSWFCPFLVSNNRVPGPIYLKY